MSLLDDTNTLNLDKIESDIKKTLDKTEKKIVEIPKDMKEDIKVIVEPSNIIPPKKTDKIVLPKSDTLIDLEVSSVLGDEYIPLLNDLSRMITLQVIIQLMLSMRDPIEYPFFSQHFFELLFYIILGLMTYWLVVKKLFKLI